MKEMKWWNIASMWVTSSQHGSVNSKHVVVWCSHVSAIPDKSELQ